MVIMLTVKDPQGHTFGATRQQLESGAACPECGWKCSMVDVAAQEPPPEPPPGLHTAKPQSETEK